MKNLLIGIFVLLFPLFILAQTVSGLWYGTLVNDSTHHKQNFELGLSEYRGKITGYSYTTFIENDTFYYSIKRIKAERKDGKLVVEDVEMVGNNFPEKAARGVKQTTVFPLINDSTIDVANGKWTTNQTKKYYSLSGKAQIQVQKDEKNSSMLAHLEELNVKNDLAVKRPQNNNRAIYDNSGSVAVAKNTAPENKKNTAKTTTDKAITNTQEKKDVTLTTIPVTKNDPPANTKTNQINTAPVNKSTDETARNTKTTQRDVAVTQQNDNRSATPNVKTTDEKKVEPIKESNNSSTQKTTGTTIVNQPPVTKASITAEKVVSLPAPVTERTNQSLEPVYFKNDSLVLALYDNGVVDGDTVSVYLNGETLMSKLRLKESATKKTIYIKPGTDSLQLVLFAENLGSIPPNTGLLTIRDGDELYQVRFSADLKQNATVILRRKRN